MHRSLLSESPFLYNTKILERNQKEILTRCEEETKKDKGIECLLMLMVMILLAALSITEPAVPYDMLYSEAQDEGHI